MSYSALGLDKAFVAGTIKHLVLRDNEKQSPPTGKRWLLLSGQIQGSDTANVSLAMVDADNVILNYITAFSIVAGPYFPIFSTIISTTSSSLIQSAWVPYFIVELNGLRFNSSASNDFCRVAVLEW